VKVTTEKLPKSLLALDIELDREQVEKGLDRAARRLSQKYNIPGFRKGKAPRFIVENYFGRGALLEEASDDLVNKAFREALDEQQIEPVGQANLENVSFDAEPFTFRVTVPVEPSITLPDYRAIRVPYEVAEVDDEMVQEAMDVRRERHVVLRDLEEPRPVQDGDELTVELDAIVDGEPLDNREPGTPPAPSTLVMNAKRLAPGLYDGLLGATIGQVVAVISQMPEDHVNERVAGKEVQFVVKVNGIQERLLPDWDEVPTLEEFEGTLDELREKTREELLETARTNAERNVVNTYIEQLVAQTEYDLPEVLIASEADRLLHDQEYQQFGRYGVTAEQVYKLQNRDRDEIVKSMLPQGEERLKINLALRELVRAEGLQISDDEVEAEVDRLVETYEDEQRERARELLSNQLRTSIANTVLDKKLRDRLMAIAAGTAPEPGSDSAASDDTPELAADTPASDDAAPELAADTPASDDAAPELAADAPANETEATNESVLEVAAEEGETTPRQ
jgi:trigger factor